MLHKKRLTKMQLTLDEYSKQYKMSKEMIHSKLRSKELESVTENEIVYIVVNQPLAKPIKRKATVATILGLYQKENQQLKQKIEQLEAKIDKLIDDKEQMLRNEMQKIEQVHTEKDMQLKNILELINAKMLAEKETVVHEIEPINLQESVHQEIIELKSYLKTLDLKGYQKKVIKKRFLAVSGKDIRIIKQNGKLYLDFSKYDYSDLLKY